MAEEPLYHQTPRGKSGVPAWWFGAPAIAFVYVWLTPRFLPDLVGIPRDLPAPLASSVRWLVGLVAGAALMAVVQIVQSFRKRGHR
jgi:hypothetical protein